MFFDNIERYKNKVALFLNKNNKIFYKDILNISKEFQKKITDRSLTILISENCMESICGYLALLRSNSVIMMLDSSIKEADLNKLIKKFEPKYLFCSVKNEKKIPKNLFSSIHSFENFNLFKNKKNISYKLNEKLMLLISTSGSIGEPKFVKLSQENMLVNTKSIISYLNLNSSDSTITTMPMSYSYGLSIINTHFFCGASIIPNQFSLVENNFWKLYKESNPTNLNGVPYFYEMLNKVGIERILDNKLKFITQAGGKIKNKIFKNVASLCLKKNISFFLMYGQTEAAPRISYHKVGKNDLNINDVPIGKVINSGKIYLREKNGSSIETPNTEGELIYKGKNIFGGYAENYNDLSSFENITELETGDLAIKNENDVYFITGRKSRFIKIFGYRLNLDYIEKKINSNNHSVICLGLDEKLYVFTKDKKLNIQNYVNLPKEAFKIINLNNFPLNNNGKVSYKKLSELAVESKIN